ncbi:MAG: hypothetical protein ACFNYI_05065, partial [Eubacterium sp.]
MEITHHLSAPEKIIMEGILPETVTTAVTPLAVQQRTIMEAALPQTAPEIIITEAALLETVLTKVMVGGIPPAVLPVKIPEAEIFSGVVPTVGSMRNSA